MEDHRLPAENLAKNRPPRLSSVITRQRLFSLIHNNRDKGLIFVIGQAAQGKSTLAASYFHEFGLKYAWINISEIDSDPVNLFHSLINSLKPVLDLEDFKFLYSYPTFSVGPRDEIGLYREWINALNSKVTFPIKLVLDGLDQLTPDAKSLNFLEILIENRSPNVQLWLISRTPYPFKVEKLKMDGSAFLISNKDLSFNLNEIKKYYQKFVDISFSPEQLEKIFILTEGWIGGQIILSEIIKRQSNDSKVSNIFDDITSKLKADTFDYFGEEILSHLSISIQKFLIVISLFDTIDPILVKCIYPTYNANSILNDLVQRNLFVNSLFIENKGYIYRYHQMFKDFLRYKFNLEISNEEKDELFEKIGKLYEDTGEIEKATKFYIQANNFSKTERSLVKLGPELLKFGRTFDLSRLLSAIPQNTIKTNPWLLLYQSITRRFTGADENTHNLSKALDLFKSNNDIRGQIVALAYLIEACLLRGRDTIPIGILLEYAENILNEISVDEFSWESATLWYQIGFGFTLRAADQRKGVQACQNSYLIANKLGNLPLQISALSTEMLALSLLGEFAKADEISIKIDKLLKIANYPELQATHYINFSQFCTIKGDLRKAQAFLLKSKTIIDKEGLMYLYPVMLITELMLKPHLNMFNEANASGQELLQLTDAFGIEFLNGIGSMFLAVNSYLNEDYTTAKKYVDKSCAIVSSDRSYSETHIAWNKLIMGLVLYHLKDYNKSEILLKESLVHFEEVSATLTLALSHFAYALLKWEKNDRLSAAENLNIGLRIAINNEFHHIIFLNHKDFIKIIFLSIELNLPGIDGYAEEILSKRIALIDPVEINNLLYHKNSRIKKRSRNILRSVHRKNLPKLKVITLNGFSVLRDGEIISEDQWGGNLTKMVLKTLIARGGKGVPKDLVMEDLWPEEAVPASESNLKVNLHRLRKVVEPSMIKEFGSSYIHLDGNMISLDSDLWEIDVNYFYEQLKNAEMFLENGNLSVAIKFYNEAINIYAKDFLVDDLYNDIISQRKDAIREEYLRTLVKVANLYVQNGSFRKSAKYLHKIIKADPFNESAYQKLMENYSNTGKRNEALKIYKNFKELLKRELNSEPDILTKSIYNKILST